MGRKRHKFVPNDFERTGGNNLSASIYATMMDSKAWRALSKNAMVLYMYMKLQLYGQVDKPNGQPDCFFFNKGLYIKAYGLYKNGEQFNRDKQQLIQYGFIDEIENGQCSRTKNIYKFSSRWKDFGG